MQPDLLLRPSASLAAAVDGYLLALQIEQRSPKTLRFYRQALALFLRFADPARPADIDTRLFRRYLQYRVEAGLATRSQHNYGVATKSFVRWLAAEEIYGVNAAFLARVRAPRVDSEQTRPFGDGDVLRLFAACNQRSWTGQRMRAILAVLLDTGIRASAPCGLQLGDVALGSGELTLRAVTVKTRMEQTTWLGVRAKREVSRWWECKRHPMDQRPKSAFFMGWNERPMSDRTLHWLLQRHGDRAGVPGTHPHRFRHTFTRNCIRAGMDHFTVQALLGHSDLTMTEKYYLAEAADVSVAKRAKSPLDQLKGRF